MCPSPERTTAVVIGAGHAGLAASHFLAGQGVDHVVLERGEVANSWSRERWDSLRLLTPNWLARLPGFRYDGEDPDGYMTAAEVAGLIKRYASAAGAPLRTGTAVRSLERDGGGYRVRTDAGDLQAHAVVIASGACNRPVVPAVAEAVPREVDQLTAFEYRSPSELRDAGVLVVGAAATGVQLAAEIKASGRPVTLAVGEHVRMPRTYRGRDVLWWMDASGVWDQGHHEIDDLTRARRLPSPQLVGAPERTTLDLQTLSVAGVELVGRLAAVRDGEALFSGGLRNALNLADLKLARLLDTFDEWAALAGCDAPDGERSDPIELLGTPRLRLDLRSGEIGTIIWATGYRPDYSWLNVPALDSKGLLRHDGGVVTESPGLYALGLPVLRRRKSTFIHGIEDDAREVIAHLVDQLPGAPAAARGAALS